MVSLLMRLGLLTHLKNNKTGDVKMFGIKNLILNRTFKSTEITGAYDGAAAAGIASGLVTGTRVATNIGWRMVEAIAPGDLALTFDGGMQVVCRITRNILWSSPKNCPEHLWPLHVPAGALGNQNDMQLLPEQVVMIESDAAEDCFGDPFALMPAAALRGFNGIAPVKPHGDIVVYTLHFEQEQIVFACSSALFHCPSVAQLSLLDMPTDSPYEALPMHTAAALVARMDQDTVAPKYTAAA